MPLLQRCHMFCAIGITAYLASGGTLDHAQEMAAHESPRTTKLSDRGGTAHPGRGGDNTALKPLSVPSTMVSTLWSLEFPSRRATQGY